MISAIGDKTEEKDLLALRYCEVCAIRERIFGNGFVVNYDACRSLSGSRLRRLVESEFSGLNGNLINSGYPFLRNFDSIYLLEPGDGSSIEN